MSIVVCIDFGTSMSKVAVSIDEGIPFPVPLGALAEDPVKENTFDSSLLFSRDGNVYVGHKAIRQSISVRPMEPRLDSLKRRLTTGSIKDLSSISIPEALNHTGTDFKLSEALIILLAQIIKLTHQYLDRHYDNIDKDQITYRFTRPVFPKERAEWVDSVMASSLRSAVLLSALLDSPDSGVCNAEELRAVIDAEEPGLEVKIESHGIPEPVAASVLHLQQQNARTLALIVDIGAGTTDVGLFVAIQPDGAANIDRARLLAPPVSGNKAGDYLDDSLKSKITANAGNLNAQDNIELELNIRRWKEDLFNLGETVPVLSGGRALDRVLRHDFENSTEYGAMKDEIAADIAEILENGKRSFEVFVQGGIHAADHIKLIPAGGGARLPMFSDLQACTCNLGGRVIRLQLMSPYPRSNRYGDEFPQLAVALGGSVSNNLRI